MISPETDSEREYVEQLTNLLLTAEGLRRGGNEEQADAYLAPVPVWKSLGHQLYGDRAAGLVEVAYAAAREREAMAIVLADKEEFPPTLPHLDKLLSVEPTTTTTTPVPATTTTTTTTSAPKKVDKVVKKEAKKTATTTTTPGFSVETGTFRSAATTTTAAPSDTVTFKSPATVTVQSAPTTTTTPPPFRSTASRLTHDRGV